MHRPLLPATEIAADAAVRVLPVRHEALIVLHADCDLLRDYEERSRARSGGKEADPNHPNVLPQIVACDMHDENTVKQRVQASDLWKRIRQNQDERYHKLSSSPIGDGSAILPDFVLDFRKPLGLYTGELYQAIESAGVVRVAVVPAVYLQQLMHRFFAYLSRVGLPD